MIKKVIDLTVSLGKAGRLDQVIELLQDYLNKTDDAEEIAICFLMLGQTYEQLNDYKHALKYYLQGIEKNPLPKNNKVAYLLYNNTGYCYNRLKEFEKGEAYCETAIEINPCKANAYKNRGISLEGQENIIGAAMSYIMSIYVNSSDKRAFMLLKELFYKHPEILEQDNGLKELYQECLNLQIYE